MELSKKIAAAAIGMSLLASPALVGGQTVAELQAQIAALLAQINALQAQLAGLQGGAAGACSFTRNLFVGVRGDDVKCLQNYLIGAGQSIPAGATGYFGSQTQAAVAAWQTANGVSPAAGYFGPISRAKYSSLAGTAPTTPTTPAPGITTPGAEGSLVATIESVPTGATMNVRSVGVGVMAVKLKASGSDIKVDRVDLNFNARPWLYVSNLTITDGTTSRTVAVSSANSTEIAVGSSYDVRVDGLNIIVPKDTEKVLTVKVDAVSGLPGSETSKDVTVRFNTNAIRGIDGANIQQYAPTSALASRIFTVKIGDTAALEISAHASNPKARAVIVQSTTETADVVLAVMNVKATGNAAILRTVEFTDSVASGTLDVVGLYDGETLLSSTSSITSTTSVIEDVNLTIPKDTTKVLTLKATVRKSQGNYETAASATVASSSISLPANATTFSAEDATSFAAATVNGSAVSPGAAYFYLKAPSFSLVSTEVTGIQAPSGSTSPHRANAKIRLNVTANGGDIYIQRFSATKASSGLVAAVSSASTTLIGETITSNADVDGTASDDPWIIRSGDTKYLEWSGTIDNDVANIGGETSVYAFIQDINWGTSGGLAGADEMWTTEDGQIHLADFKTSSIFLVGVRQ